MHLPGRQQLQARRGAHAHRAGPRLRSEKGTQRTPRTGRRTRCRNEGYRCEGGDRCKGIRRFKERGRCGGEEIRRPARSTARLRCTHHRGETARTRCSGCRARKPPGKLCAQRARRLPEPAGRGTRLQDFGLAQESLLGSFRTSGPFRHRFATGQRRARPVDERLGILRARPQHARGDPGHQPARAPAHALQNRPLGQGRPHLGHFRLERGRAGRPPRYLPGARAFLRRALLDCPPLAEHVLLAPRLDFAQRRGLCPALGCARTRRGNRPAATNQRTRGGVRHPAARAGASARRRPARRLRREPGRGSAPRGRAELGGARGRASATALASGRPLPPHGHAPHRLLRARRACAAGVRAGRQGRALEDRPAGRAGRGGARRLCAV